MSGLDSQQISPALVQRLVQEVVKALEEMPAGPDPQGPEIYILAPREEVDESRLRALLPSDARLVYLADCHCPITRGREYDRIILPRLDLGPMADLALGRAAGPMAGGILTLLMGGRTIEVLDFAHDAFRATAPAPLMTLYDGYETTLAGFGLVRFEAAKQMEEGPVAPITAGKKRLITEAQVAEAAAGGAREIRLAPGSLVTALARDLARDKGIEIIIARKGNEP